MSTMMKRWCCGRNKKERERERENSKKGEEEEKKIRGTFDAPGETETD